MTTLVKRDGGLSLLPGLTSLFDNPLSMKWVNWPNVGDFESRTTPAVNISETEDKFLINVAAPGMKKDDFKIELDNNQLVITGEQKEEKEEKNGEGTDHQYLLKEYSYRSFVRSFSLADKLVEGDKIQAKYTDGILYITIPKSAAAKPRPPKQIAIN